MEKIVIYCASGYGERVAYALDDTKYDIIGFIDSSQEAWGGTSQVPKYISLKI